MKSMRILLLAIAFALFQPAAEAAVRILKISGNVSFSTNHDRDFKKLSATEPIKGDSIIRTGKNSYVDLQFENAVLVRVVQNSEFIIDRSQTEFDDWEVKLHCREGRIICASQTLTRYSKFEVKTQISVCGTRGDTPEFDVNSGGIVRCVSGEVVEFFITNGTIIPPVTLGPGETIADSWLDPSKLKQTLHPKILKRVSAEIADLKKSLANSTRKK